MQVRHCPATVNVSDFSKTTVKRWEGKRSVDHKSGDLPIASTPETLRGIAFATLGKTALGQGFHLITGIGISRAPFTSY